MKKLLIATLAVVLMLGVAATSEAVILASGGSSVTAGVASPGSGDPILASITGAAFSTTTGVVTGTYDAWVRQDADGFLVFEYQVHNAGSSADAIHRVTVITFTGFATDVDAAGVAGISIDRSLSGGTIGWDDFIGGGIAPGASSPLLWVKTDAKHYSSGFISLINGGVDTKPAFQPAVPEPTSMMLFGTGLLGFVGRLRKRFAA